MLMREETPGMSRLPTSQGTMNFLGAIGMNLDYIVNDETSRYARFDALRFSTRYSRRKGLLGAPTSAAR